MAKRFSWLCRYSRPIPVAGSNVRVLKEPQEFYDTLRTEASNARRRIVITSLYLGTGQLENELVDTLSHSLDKTPSLSCTVLLDHLRGSRGKPNSRTMLNRLNGCYGNQFRLFLYHTPQLRGVLQRVFPERYNEVVGVNHTKIYLFDDTLILSGANLAHDYFTNRQDRYIMFRNCPSLADHFSTLAHILCDHSFQIDSSNTPHVPTATNTNPLSSKKAADVFKQSLYNSVTRLINTSVPGSLAGDFAHTYSSPGDSAHTDSSPGDYAHTNSSPGDYAHTNSSPGDSAHTNSSPGDSAHTNSSPGDSAHTNSSPGDSGHTGADTLVFPLVQMGQYGISQDEQVTRQLLGGVAEGERVCLATGYFNPPSEYVQAILNSRGQYRILAAAPEAIGFYGARGVAGKVPYMYIQFAKQFLSSVQEVENHRVQYLEYSRPGWTFHTKGVWYYLPDEATPSLTLMGSSNYGHRSLTRDLEAQVAMVTSNTDLRQCLHQEQENVYSRGKELSLYDMNTDPSRRLSIPVKIATQLLKQHV